MIQRAPSLEDPFTLATLEDDTVSKLVEKLASELLGRFYVDATDCELTDNGLLVRVEAEIEDTLREAILGFETPDSVVMGFERWRKVRAA